MPIFFILVVLTVIIFHLRLMYLNKNDDRAKKLETYLSEDYAANFARARAIDEQMFIRLLETDFPFKDYFNKDEEELIRIQKKVKLNLSAPLIKTGIPTNTEIKARFGLSNLQTVINGEENYTLLIQNLNRWAGLLIKRGNSADAQLILEKAVLSGADISETYIMLYKLYCETGENEKIEALTEKARELPDVAQARVLNCIKTPREENEEK